MGTRHDLARDPQVKGDLLIARRGTAFWARALNDLRDTDLDGPSRLPGWTRRHLVAHVGYNARALSRLVGWAVTGIENPMYTSPEAREEEIELGATLPPHALRHLSEHAAISLDVMWRDADEQAWQGEVRTAQGRMVTLSATPWMRIREVWLHAVDLDSGCELEQLPACLADRLLDDVVQTWQRKGIGMDLVLVDTDSGKSHAVDSGSAQAVRASRYDLLGWATGRRELAGMAPAPRWL